MCRPVECPMISSSPNTGYYLIWRFCSESTSLLLCCYAWTCWKTRVFTQMINCDSVTGLSAQVLGSREDADNQSYYHPEEWGLKTGITQWSPLNRWQRAIWHWSDQCFNGFKGSFACEETSETRGRVFMGFPSIRMKTSSCYQSSSHFTFNYYNYHNFMASSKSGKQFPLLFDAVKRWKSWTNYRQEEQNSLTDTIHTQLQ